MHAGSLDDVVLPTQSLGHVGVEEGHESEGAERLGDEDIDDLAIFAEVVVKIVICDVLGAASDEDFPVGWWTVHFLQQQKQM